MIFREAQLKDIPGMMDVRASVKENVLNNPSLATHKDYENYLMLFGKGWVCEVLDKVVGFAIAGLSKNNIWALFVCPEYEAKGIGHKLHNLLLTWYFKQTQKKSGWVQRLKQEPKNFTSRLDGHP
jgi:GNAT superfamily N-acetyltransferase